MYHKFNLLLFCLTIYSQFSIVVHGEDELRHTIKKKKGSQKKPGQSQQVKTPTVCIVPIPLQAYQPSYVHSGDQFQHSYIGSNQELRKKGKPTMAEMNGCVVVTPLPPTSHTLDNADNASGPGQALKKKKPAIFKPHKIKRKKKRKKIQAQVMAQLESDLGMAFKDLMTSLDYFWPKLQITFTTGTASIGHNIFTGIVPLMAAGLKLKKILFFMMDPMFSSMMYSLGYGSSYRPKLKSSESGNEEVQDQEAQDNNQDASTYADQSDAPGYSEEGDEDEEEAEDDSEEQDDEDEEDDEKEEYEGEEEDSEEASDDSDVVDTEPLDANDDGNIDYPSKDSAEVNLRPKKKKKKSDGFMGGLEEIWDGMVEGFDDLAMTDQQYRSHRSARNLPIPEKRV
ncbi:transcription initiation factor TFIID subunit 11-like [Phlebotomus argentipes]|uniref:transcription initiation factor TFIID subunit 11-like n=1 Tax=Phlebotomus argentipes TaxID=94469 RepID=UPI002892B541|nr:transcription initiation factor TFIID subunit 11-like [Phlebotomus argentipes]